MKSLALLVPLLLAAVPQDDKGQNPPPPADTDRDGVPDYRDRDSDNDGVPDGVDGNVSSDASRRPGR